MRERLHVVLSKAGETPALDPGPSPNVGDRVFAFAVASEVIFGFAGVFARELDFENAVDAEGFVLEAFDGVCFVSIVICVSLGPFGGGQEWERGGGEKGEGD